MIFKYFILILSFIYKTYASESPGLFCPAPDYTSLLVRLNYLEIEVRTVKDLVNAIDGIEELTELITAVDGLQALPGQFDSLKEDVEQDISDLGIRIGDLQTSYDARLSGIDDSIGTLNAGQAAIEVKIDDLETEVANCEVKQAELQAQIDVLKVGVAELEASTEALEAGQTDLTARVEALETGLSGTKQQVDDLADAALFTFDAWGEWGDCSVTCGLGTRNRERTCPGAECASADGKGTVDTEICDTDSLCPFVDSGKVLIIGGVQSGSDALDVPSEVLDFRNDQRCSAPSYATDYRDGIFGTLLWNMFPVIAGGDSIKEVIHVIKQDGTIADLKVEGDGESRKYAGAVTLGDKEHMYIVGGYYAAQGRITDSTEVIHLNKEGTVATGEHGPSIPKKLVYPCFTDFRDTDGNRKFFLFGGSTSVSPLASEQVTAFSTSGWVLDESDFDAENDASWDSATSTPDFTLASLAFITCKAFKTSSGEEEIMIVGQKEDTFSTYVSTFIYTPSSNTFRTGSQIKLDNAALNVNSYWSGSMYASIIEENEVVITGGYLGYNDDSFSIIQTEDYSKYVFKMTCPEGETDAANCPFETQFVDLKTGRHSHVTFHIPDAFATCP